MKVKYEKIAAIVTILVSISSAIYAVEDRFELKDNHKDDMAEVMTKSEAKMNSEFGKMKMIDIEIDLTNLMIESKLKIPLEKRSVSFESDIETLRLKKQFLIKHKSYGE